MRQQPSSPPRVIFCDALGTLFGMKGSVGKIYSTIAREVGVKCNPDRVEEAFRESFSESRSPIFPGVDSFQIPEREFLWWEAIARNTFSRVGVLDHFDDFDAFFTKLYAHFATTQPWYVYDDVLPALEKWKSQGIELGIISNFDTRLYGVLELLDLKDFFSSITISSLVGAAKPDSKIFLSALDRHHCPPHLAWHIGDSFNDDYQGAIKAGLRPYLVKR